MAFSEVLYYSKGKPVAINDKLSRPFEGVIVHDTKSNTLSVGYYYGGADYLQTKFKVGEYSSENSWSLVSTDGANIQAKASFSSKANVFQLDKGLGNKEWYRIESVRSFTDDQIWLIGDYYDKYKDEPSLMQSYGYEMEAATLLERAEKEKAKKEFADSGESDGEWSGGGDWGDSEDSSEAEEITVNPLNGVTWGYALSNSNPYIYRLVFADSVLDENMKLLPSLKPHSLFIFGEKTATLNFYNKGEWETYYTEGSLNSSGYIDEEEDDTFVDHVNRPLELETVSNERHAWIQVEDKSNAIVTEMSWKEGNGSLYVLNPSSFKLEYKYQYSEIIFYTPLMLKALGRYDVASD
ncbi:hypothetical protein R9C00_23235 [Flammeovirgaceae bacterium SG7u.111]|nr:hypothetical protein [Flammeovirgaceae bacterium SG7u.132]WPO34620.1 hypothetical protein R9C00_23235 [Flammeovirgaceae bacterium SG7u.111]